MLICLLWSTNTSFPVCWNTRLSSSEEVNDSSWQPFSYGRMVSNWGENWTAPYFQRRHNRCTEAASGVLGWSRQREDYIKSLRGVTLLPEKQKDRGCSLGSPGVLLSPLHRALWVTDTDRSDWLKNQALLVWLYSGSFKAAQWENNNKEDLTSGTETLLARKLPERRGSGLMAFDAHLQSLNHFCRGVRSCCC